MKVFWVWTFYAVNQKLIEIIFYLNKKNFAFNNRVIINQFSIKAGNINQIRIYEVISGYEVSAHDH